MTDVTAADIAEFLTNGDNDYIESLDGWPGLTATDNVLRITFTPTREDEHGDAEADEDNIRHFRAVVVEGEQTPALLAGPAYINTSDGYTWLTCTTCQAPLWCIAGGEDFADLNAEIAKHTCGGA